MDFIHEAIEWTPAILALVGCAFGWWYWLQARKSVPIPTWRRVAGTGGLLLVNLSIAFGAFAWIYWTRSAGPGPAPPRLTYITTFVGFYLVVAAVPVLLCAKGRTRAMLLLSSVGLFGFYFLMFLSP